VDVEGDLGHAEVEEDREAGGAGSREPEAGLPRDQHLPLRIPPLRRHCFRRRCRCHSREGGMGVSENTEGACAKGLCVAQSSGLTKFSSSGISQSGRYLCFQIKFGLNRLTMFTAKKRE
jgi:hypothetical protein